MKDFNQFIILDWSAIICKRSTKIMKFKKGVTRKSKNSENGLKKIKFTLNQSQIYLLPNEVDVLKVSGQ